MRASPDEEIPHSTAILKSENFQSDSKVLSMIIDMSMVESKLFLDQLNLGTYLVSATFWWETSGQLFNLLWNIIVATTI